VPTSSHVTDEMRGIVGRVVDRRVSFPIDASDLRRWAIAVYHPDPAPREFLTIDHHDVVAPQEFNPFAWMVAEQLEPIIPSGRRDPDRHEKNAGVLGPALPFQIAAGLEAEYGVGMRTGDVITSAVTLQEYREREGRLGLMLFTVVRDEWTNQRSERVKVSLETSIRYGA
jgi:hypothetical protein